VFIRHLWQLKTVVFLHWYLIGAVLLQTFVNYWLKKFYNVGPSSWLTSASSPTLPWPPFSTAPTRRWPRRRFRSFTRRSSVWNRTRVTKRPSPSWKLCTTRASTGCSTISGTTGSPSTPPRRFLTSDSFSTSPSFWCQCYCVHLRLWRSVKMWGGI
jgi:hypothetical protein